MVNGEGSRRAEGGFGYRVAANPDQLIRRPPGRAACADLRQASLGNGRGAFLRPPRSPKMLTEKPSRRGLWLVVQHARRACSAKGSPPLPTVVATWAFLLRQAPPPAIVVEHREGKQ